MEPDQEFARAKNLLLLLKSGRALATESQDWLISYITGCNPEQFKEFADIMDLLGI